MLRRNLNFENSSLLLAQLRRMIDAGETGQDGRLPTERELSAMFSVGRRAVRRAVEVLEAEGLLWRRQGKGTFVGQPPDPTGALAAQIAGDTAPAAPDPRTSSGCDAWRRGHSLPPTLTPPNFGTARCIT
jgi:DNA-binding FadR family transcriptional regulator